MNKAEIKAILTELTELISDGVHIVDMDGVSLVYNSAMEKIEDMRGEDILGEPISETFQKLSEEESTLKKALINKEKMLKVKQTYENKDGKEITTINNTVPVIVEGKIIGAIEVATDLTSIKNVTEKMIEYKNAKPQIRTYGFEDFIGNSANFLGVIERAKMAATTDASVFIYGETGTGKEILSQSIHYNGNRKKAPFIAQNCAAIPDSLFEGILFGTAKGGFTGAIDRKGLFEQADGGTLLLDELSAMPYDLQSKLLRVLQEGYVRRVGGTKDIPIDVRIIATVNEDPFRLMEEGALRKDLYYRISIVNLEIPPLRERKADIQMLAEHFLEKNNRGLGKRVEGFTPQAMEQLMKRDYTGNVRELENTIMSAVALSGNEKILDVDLFNNEWEKDFGNSKNQEDFDSKKESLSDYLEKQEREIIIRTMGKLNGNVTQVAESLGMKRQTLQHKLKKYEIAK